jgi:hypothetical protein
MGRDCLGGRVGFIMSAGRRSVARPTLSYPALPERAGSGPAWFPAELAARRRRAGETAPGGSR